VRTVNGTKLLHYCFQAGTALQSVMTYVCVLDVTSGVPRFVRMLELDSQFGLYDFFNGTVAVNVDGTIALNVLSSGPQNYIAQCVFVLGPDDPAWNYARVYQSQVPLNGNRVGDYSCLANGWDKTFWSVNQPPCNNPKDWSPNFNWCCPVQQFALV
jgi:hypothetical protein